MLNHFVQYLLYYFKYYMFHALHCWASSQNVSLTYYCPNQFGCMLNNFTQRRAVRDLRLHRLNAKLFRTKLCSRERYFREFWIGVCREGSWTLTLFKDLIPFLRPKPVKRQPIQGKKTKLLISMRKKTLYPFCNLITWLEEALRVITRQTTITLLLQNHFVNT